MLIRVALALLLILLLPVTRSEAQFAHGTAFGSIQGFSLPEALSGSGLPSAPTVVQTVSNNSTSASSVPVVMAAAQLAGHANVCLAMWGDLSTTVTSVTDTAGNCGSGYSVAAPLTIGSTGSQEIFWCNHISASAAGANTVTMNLSSAAPFPEIVCTDMSNVGGIDAAASSGVGTSTSASSGALNTTHSADLVFGGGSTANVFSAAGTGFTLGTITNFGNLTEWRTTSTTGNYPTTASLPSSAAWIMQGLAFYGATPTGAPVISNVLVTPSSTSAVVTWLTNQNSDSTVNYGATSSYGSSQTNATLVVSHSITITGLSPSTTYHFDVVSKNASNQTTSSSDATFTTGAPSVSADGATATPGTGSLTDNGGNAWTVTAGGVVQVNGSNAGFSAGVLGILWYGNQDGTSGIIYQWTAAGWWGWVNSTWEVEPGDPRTLLNIAATPTSTTAATFTWTTVKAGTSRADYGLTTGYGSNVTSATNVTSHSVTATGLTAATTYHYKVTTVLASGETLVSSDGTFTTPASGAAFVALHTYFMAPATASPPGNDGNAGTSAAPWLTPNHSGLVCGDVIIAKSGAYTTAGFDITQSPGSCPSSSGGIDGTGGVYFVTLLCATPFTCTINYTTIWQGGFTLEANNWAIEGWSVTNGANDANNNFFCYKNRTDNSLQHHQAFINDLALDCGIGFSTDHGNGTSGHGQDYFAEIGNLAWSANWRSNFPSSAINVVTPQDYDTAAVTRTIVDGNFAIHNQVDSGNGNTCCDMEAYMFDTPNMFNYSGQVVYKNNIGTMSSWVGLQYTINTGTGGAAQTSSKLYAVNNTFYGNMQCITYTPGTSGEINLVQDGSIQMNDSITLTDNIARATVTTIGCNSGGSAAVGFNSGGRIGTGGSSGSGNWIFGGVNNQNSFSLGSVIATDPAFANTTDLTSNHAGQPNCSGKPDVAACMGWDFSGQTASANSVIADLVPTATGTSGKGYQPPHACAADSLWPAWLKGVVYLQWDGTSLTEQQGLVNKPCGT
jgi:hypothetical protein